MSKLKIKKIVNIINSLDIEGVEARCCENYGVFDNDFIVEIKGHFYKRFDTLEKFDDCLRVRALCNPYLKKVRKKIWQEAKKAGLTSQKRRKPQPRKGRCISAHNNKKGGNKNDNH